MKFGKYIQSQQSEWGGAHHLNYKALKKIINSVEALTPSSHSHSQTTISIVSSSTNSNHADTTRQFQALKTAFFFKLERELEKVNSFYLQKEQEFKVRQRSLLDKKRILQSRSVAIKTSSNLESLREAFLQFQRDLAKLQSYVEINATGFTKILKKWDKRAKSTTKEFYLSRQVVIQPCFNRDVLTELTDVVTMNIAELDALLDAAQSRTDSIPIKITVEPLQPQQRSWDPLMEAENDFLSAITESRVDYLKDSLKKFTHKSGTSASSLREEDPELLSRVFLRACDEGPIDMLSALFDSEDVTINCDFMDDISNRTCIHEAAIHGRLDVLTLAISRGKANIDAVDIYDRYGIHYAAMYGHSDCLLFLLSQYSSAAAASAVDVDDNTPLTYAIIGGHTKCVQLLLQHGVALDPPAATTLNPLSLACQYGHLAIATLLLEKGASLHDATTPASSAHPQQITEGNNLPSLHLTAREGHAELCALLIRSGADVNETDSYSGWTPIFFAASEGHISCVKVLLDAHCRVDVTDEDGWLPWTYALYHGHVDVAKLLEISQPVMKSPGSALSPTAAATVTSASPALSSSLGSLSAVVGIPIITSSGATAMAVDSSDLSVSSLGSDGPIMLADRGTADTLPMDIPLQPMAPSALFSENTVVTPAAGGFEFEMSLDEIPSLSLPPPMIPFRIYGHNYLDKQYYVEVNLNGFADSLNSSPVKLFGSQKLSSYRLVISSKPDSIPYNVILPLTDDSESYTFFVDNLAEFSLYFEIYPTFGTKILGRAAVLSSQFTIGKGGAGSGDEERVVAPFFDSHLKVVGELSFGFSIVSALNHPGVKIGGKIETYWKSTKVVSDKKGHGDNSIQSLITATSMAEEYIHLSVQMTRDGVPVIYDSWYLDLFDLDEEDETGSSISRVSHGFPITSLTHTQARKLFDRSQKTGNSQHQRRSQEYGLMSGFDGRADGFWSSEPVLRAGEGGLRASRAELPRVIADAFFTLDELLENLPPRIGVSLDLQYPTPWQRERLHICDVPSVNKFVDRVLTSVYDHTTATSRPVIFSSFNPAVCTAITWKQPNYGVFFATRCGFGDGLGSVVGMSAAHWIPTSRETDRRCTSIKQAVRFARRNKFLGVICEAKPLIQMPALIRTIKESGLILVSCGEANSDYKSIRRQEANGVDATVSQNVLKYNITGPTA